MEQGDLCYIPQGAVMIKQDSAALPVGHYTNEKPTSALILENEPSAKSMYILFKGEKWAILKREVYPLEKTDAR
tara:strand:- start:44 stop:265 length:222 start_codon:yes stop_codon:yes gene_type:complete